MIVLKLGSPYLGARELFLQTYQSDDFKSKFLQLRI